MDDFEAIQKNVMADHRESWKDLDDVALYYHHFGHIRIKQFEQIIEDHPENEELINAAKLAIDNTRMLASFA